jgi:predicted dehydrogenase
MKNIGIIGCGYWGPNLVRNFVELPGCTVSHLCDLDRDRLETISRRFLVEEATEDYRQILDASEIDGVVIATPAATHYQIAKEALQAGKHTLVEKPLAMTSAQCKELIELADQQGVVLMVGHTFLYNEAVRWLKNYLDSGQMGDILYIYSQRLNLGKVRQDVSALWNFAPHDISIILYLLGTHPNQVNAKGLTYLQEGIPDIVFMTLDFENGTSAHIHISWLDPNKVRKMTVVGSDKMVVYDDVSAHKIQIFDKGVDKINKKLSEFKGFGEFQLMLRSGDLHVPALKIKEPLSLEAAHFIECIEIGQRPLSDGWSGYWVVKIMEAADVSISQNGAPVAISC